MWRKILIVFSILFHFCAVLLWILPPYAEMVAQAPFSKTLAGSFERQLFTTLQPTPNSSGSRLIATYVDWLGAYQYWDFFAPQIPRVHRYLEVCTRLRESPNSRRIDCIDWDYRSFAGAIDRVTLPHHGQSSRSYRLVENLWRLKRVQLLDSFTRYWANKIGRDEGRATFLLLHEYTLRPGHKPANARHDEVIWMTDHSENPHYFDARPITLRRSPITLR